MTPQGQVPGPVMRPGTGLHANKTGRELAENLKHLRPPQLPPNGHLPVPADGVGLKNTRGKVKADCGNLLQGWLLGLGLNENPITLRANKSETFDCLKFTL